MLDLVMFFESESATPATPEPPPWTAPPRLSLSGILPMNRILASGAKGAVALTLIRAFQTGCLIETECAVARPATRAELVDLFGLTSRTGPEHFLPAAFVRFGVEFPDGRTATVLERHPVRLEDGPAPEPPVLAMVGGGRGTDGQTTWVDTQQLLWLWPLPPAQTFDLVFEWPVAGIGMTRVPIDGAAVVEAAGEARPFVGG
jgi:hypothetical protein